MVEQLVSVTILLSVGYVSSQISLKLKIPAGRLIGPILAIAFLKILGLDIVAPNYFIMICSIIMGVFIGLKFNKNTLNQLKSVFKPGIILISWYLFITFVYGWLLLEASFLEKSTAFLSVVPGGIAEVSVLALSYHADLAQITSFQLARLLTIVFLVPILVKKVFPDNGEHYGDEDHLENKSDPNTSISKKNWWVFFVLGSIGSIIFTILNFPAGRLIGAIFFIATYNFSPFKKVSKPPVYFYNFAQVGMGSIIGTNFTRESFFSVPTLSHSIVLITFLIIFNSLVLAWIFSKIFKWDFITGFLSIIPGGLAPMVLIADQVKADVVVVGSLQLLRLITAILIIPVVYSFFL
ncbi:MAG: uncharacterized protein PWQ67_367 [Clostridia bacterium]|nr:uncharacterized protein [Clostridia bacterium]MDN5321913.1 uncharacterized protein [Clostridia bacterium]